MALSKMERDDRAQDRRDKKQREQARLAMRQTETSQPHQWRAGSLTAVELRARWEAEEGK